MQRCGETIKLHAVEMLMKTAKASERRQKPRVESTWPVALKLREGEISGVVENISPIGAFIAVKDSPQLKGSFRMIIKPPNCQTLSVTAEVVWTTIFTHDEREPCLGVGVRFVHISEGDSQFLYELVVSFYIV